MIIKEIKGRQILDSRGNPTVEADVILDNGIKGSAAVPSGASTGVHEAMELRDEDKDQYLGKGVLKAVASVNGAIAEALKGNAVDQQEQLDTVMLELDGTENKSKLGANAILAVSMACARAAAQAEGVWLYEYLGRFRKGETDDSYVLPVPFMNVINGGKHAQGGVDFQEFMLVPHGFDTFSEALEAGDVVFHTLKKLLHSDGFTTLVGDEGGFAPAFERNDQALEYLVKAITEAGYTAGEQIAIAMDPAVSELLMEDGLYELKSEDRKLTGEEMIGYWDELTGRFPIVSLEDGLDQDAWDEWKVMTQRLRDKTQLVGDDFLVTNVKRLQRAIDEESCNSILIKVNQIGSLTEAIAAINLAMEHGFTAMVSHRSGETEDPLIADLAVGLCTGQIKAGSLSRSDRIAKYNQLLRIEEHLGDRAVYRGLTLQSRVGE